MPSSLTNRKTSNLLLEKLQEIAPQSKFESEKEVEKITVNLPIKTKAILLEESDINVGQIGSEICYDCGQIMKNFNHMKSHFVENHQELWKPELKENVVTCKNKIERNKKG